MPTRRQYLRDLATAGAGVAVVGAAQPVAAEHAAPNDVTISFDKERLDRYKPLLQMAQDDRELFEDLHGWIASSPNHTLDVFVYWAEYRRQKSPWWAPGTGHWGDHEPVALEVDPDTETAVTVRASVLHWVKGEQNASTVPMDGENPRLRVISPHHQYTAAEPDAPVTDFEVKDLRSSWDSWLANGLEDAVVVGASYNPWVMRSEETWWQDRREAFKARFLTPFFDDRGSLSA